MGSGERMLCINLLFLLSYFTQKSQFIISRSQFPRNFGFGIVLTRYLSAKKKIRLDQKSVVLPNSQILQVFCRVGKVFFLPTILPTEHTSKP